MHQLIDSADPLPRLSEGHDERPFGGVTDSSLDGAEITRRSTESFQPALLHPIVQAAIRSVALAVIFLLLTGAYLTLLGQSNLPPAQAPPPLMQLDINQAELQDWMLMPGIGRVTAQKIIADREANGPFTGLDNLQRVPGIGPKTIEQLSPYCVSSPLILKP